ncbi:hypothetical protein DDZ14_03895 [Maritimibacter sp. 55A14]|uniref:hypothetical protein n=1 Tax=Maritimibacter sp. 55A14 TaxID=2174844 RepID=UPI000D6040A1|nr:hypothetical protein [Maritimibacter sp. 55A14]PWE33813.1 hypothetical protein DDZ14_03895 [Maritimibacter sp. 55A14]
MKYQIHGFCANEAAVNSDMILLLLPGSICGRFLTQFRKFLGRASQIPNTPEIDRMIADQRGIHATSAESGL